jgi:hypothetical protein
MLSLLLSASSAVRLFRTISRPVVPERVAIAGLMIRHQADLRWPTPAGIF